MNIRRFAASALLPALAVLAVARSSRADDAASPPPQATRPFGAKGSVVLSDLFGVRLQSEISTVGGYVAPVEYVGLLTFDSQSVSTRIPPTSSPGTSSSQLTLIGLSPSVDYFIADRFSIGARAGASYLRLRTSALNTDGTPYDAVTTGYDLTLRPRVGWVVPVASDLYFWPRAGFSIENRHASASADVASLWEYGASVDAGFVVRLGSHALFDFGPALEVTHFTSDDTLLPSYDSTRVNASFVATIDVAL